MGSRHILNCLNHSVWRKEVNLVPGIRNGTVARVRRELRELEVVLDDPLRLILTSCQHNKWQITERMLFTVSILK